MIETIYKDFRRSCNCAVCERYPFTEIFMCFVWHAMCTSKGKQRVAEKVIQLPPTQPLLNSPPFMLSVVKLSMLI